MCIVPTRMRQSRPNLCQGIRIEMTVYDCRKARQCGGLRFEMLRSLILSCVILCALRQGLRAKCYCEARVRLTPSTCEPGVGPRPGSSPGQLLEGNCAGHKASKMEADLTEELNDVEVAGGHKRRLRPPHLAQSALAVFLPCALYCFLIFGFEPMLSQLINQVRTYNHSDFISRKT